MSTSSTRSASRISAVSAVLFAICFFMTVAVLNVPKDATDAELLAWWQDGANVDAGLASMAFATLTAILFAVVVTHLLVLVGDRSPRLTGFARTMGTAFTVTLLISGAIRGVIGHLTTVEDGPLPGVDVLRYTTALNYSVTGVVVMASFGVTAIALGILVLRLGFLARWAGFVSIACGLVVLAASVALVGAYTVPVAILWALCTAVAVLRAPATPAAVESREPVGTMTV